MKLHIKEAWLMASKRVLEVFRGGVFRGKLKCFTQAAKIGSRGNDNGSSAPIPETNSSKAETGGFSILANIAALIAFVACVPAVIFNWMFRATSQQPKDSAQNIVSELNIDCTSRTNSADSTFINATPLHIDRLPGQDVSSTPPQPECAPLPAQMRIDSPWSAFPASPRRVSWNQSVGCAWHVASASLVPDNASRNTLSPAASASAAQQSPGKVLDF